MKKKKKKLRKKLRLRFNDYMLISVLLTIYLWACWHFSDYSYSDGYWHVTLQRCLFWHRLFLLNDVDKRIVDVLYPSFSLNLIVCGCAPKRWCHLRYFWNFRSSMSPPCISASSHVLLYSSRFFSQLLSLKKPSEDPHFTRLSFYHAP